MNNKITNISQQCDFTRKTYKFNEIDKWLDA